MLTDTHIPSLTWQDVDVLDSINKALKPVSDILLPHLCLCHHIISSPSAPTPILAEAENDAYLTKDLKAGILTQLELKYDDSKS
ncbi:hypothetical protein N1851_030036 [Merluccius polli]|uniref:Uncharacterized protein n=1 Tax=Merluccius polli TaxID=89951 RepID=A0AA47M6B4_MERPO|nr:hypothetical protein N1851_030036 [Merluccius polli]